MYLRGLVISCVRFEHILRYTFDTACEARFVSITSILNFFAIVLRNSYCIAISDKPLFCDPIKTGVSRFFADRYA